MAIILLEVLAQYWSKLLRSSVVNNEEGYLRIRWQQLALSDSNVVGELAIFPV